uniref:Uncharacterized protein n=1 Tax=Equus asinus asinus TaxID=83772 RepID=A0A8C4MWR9_EQUAS
MLISIIFKETEHVLTDLKGEIDSNTIIVGDFTTPLTSMDISSRQKVNKETLALNETLDHISLIDIARTIHAKAAEYTFFSSAYGIFSQTDYTFGNKSQNT